MMKQNFRRYILEKISQTKLDQKSTLKDCEKRNDKYMKKWQKEYYIGRIQAFQELYKDCKKYEWGIRNATKN